MGHINLADKISFLELLYTCNSDFKKDIKAIRKKYQLLVKRNGDFDIDRFLEFDKEILIRSKAGLSYAKNIRELAKKHDLVDYIEDLTMFTETGNTPYDLDNLQHTSSFRSKISRPRRYVFGVTDTFTSGYWVQFHVRKPVTKSDLKKWINKYADRITIEANEILSGTKASVIKLDNAQRILEVIKLRNIKSKQRKHRFTFSQIADKICEKYPDDPDVIKGKVNEVSVRQIYNRYKNKYL